MAIRSGSDCDSKFTRHRAAADATLELLQADAVAAVRFGPGERYWLGDIAPVGLGAAVK